MALKLGWRRGGGGWLALPLGNRTTASSSACSSSNLFVGGLSYDTNETALKDVFSQCGDVIAAKVICHPTSGKSKGFGFVKFSSQNQADAALQKMNGQARLSSFIYIII
ncbi:Glycine-rich RNA-binding protein 2, mitochondrial [Zea mays]|uniref:Glycine-rich RNA-binding protein 6 mitochondrial n=2 Tax=Zea mays TaxID=4577 RepID=A0A1D6MZZ8_MAIZE|nr:Glycine-rich RNA-binding protein 6 mitochondrial [Zea mays]PWZ30731.1 Glycine-rich RNA-binding protein 2, mitochondrial [Zea mays]